MDEETLRDWWATADTLAFMSFCKIVRLLKEKEWSKAYGETETFEFVIACGIASLAAKLKDAMEKAQSEICRG